MSIHAVASFLFALFLVAPGVASAGPALDYQAFAGCPDAGQFTDQVSARIGSLAFTQDGTPTVAVRLVSTGTEVLGTLEIEDRSKAVRGTTCQQVFDGLVTAATVVLDADPLPRPAAPPAAQPAPTPSTALLEIDTTQDNVVVAQIVGHGTGTGYASGTSVTVRTTFYEDLCTAPCTVEVEPGMVQLSAHGKGHRPVVETFELAAGERRSLHAEPGSAWVARGAYGLGLLGVAAVVFGGLELVTHDPEYYRLVREPVPSTTPYWLLLAGGGAAVTAAVPLWVSSRGSFSEEDPGQLVVSGQF